MAVRIYALAKELNLDSKEVVELCKKAGVQGKGSALASLSDDEAAKVKAFISGGNKKPGSSGGGRASNSTPQAPVRPTRSSSTDNKIKVIVPSSTIKATLDASTEAPLASEAASPTPDTVEIAASTLTTSEEAVEATTAEISTETSDTTAQPPSAPTETTTKASATSEKPTATSAETTSSETTSEEAVEATSAKKTGLKAAATPTRKTAAQTPSASGQAPLRREDYIGPGMGAGKMRNLAGTGNKPGTGKGPGGNNGGSKPRRAIKLAPMPIAPQTKTPVAKKKSDETKVLKPDMKLPANLIGMGKAGDKPLAAHLKKHERNLEIEKEADRTGTRKKSQAYDENEDRKGVKGGKTAGKGTRPMLGVRQQRQNSRQGRGGFGNSYRRFNRRPKKTGKNTAAPRKDVVAIELPCTIREFSEAAGIQAAQIQRMLMAEGIMTTINAMMEPEMTEMIALELGVTLEFKEAETLEVKLLATIDEIVDPEEDLVTRPPVITFLGHVDHGKTSLLDKLIGIQVADGESGGITQHIRAYTISHDKQKIAFVDTPGHEAFTQMRARGASVTDIAVIVVAADDGIMPQTEEAIAHARAAEVPIVVALNKIDLPGANIDKALQDLSTNGLLPSEWGGDTEVVRTSATTGEGLDELLDTILTIAELHEYKANPNRAAVGTCLESQQEQGRGIVSKVIVQTGTLRVGDVVVCGDTYGRVKAMYDTLNTKKRIKEATASTSIDVVGFTEAPMGGELFYVLDDIADAREIAEIRAHESKSDLLNSTGFKQVTFETLHDRLTDAVGDVQTLNLIIRADVRGSIEAIRKELTKLEHPEVQLRILQASVGGVTEADVHLASAAEAVVIGFNVVADEKARLLAEEQGVQIRRYSIIYKITDDLRDALEGMLRPEFVEKILGRTLVQQTFKVSRTGTIAGCRVLSGKVERDAKCRVIRDNAIIGDYPIASLRREKDDAKEVREGYECGIRLTNFNDIKEGDLLEIYRVDEIARTFDD